MFKDSLKIYAHASSSSVSSTLLAFLIDYVLVLILEGPHRRLARALSLNFSVITARLISATVNFTVNRKVVFKGNESLEAGPYWKYGAGRLCAGAEPGADASADHPAGLVLRAVEDPGGGPRCSV